MILLKCIRPDKITAARRQGWEGGPLEAATPWKSCRHVVPLQGCRQTSEH